MLVISFLSLLLAVSNCEDINSQSTCKEIPMQPELSWETKLNVYLNEVCKETRSMPPEHRTNVSVSFILKYFYFDAGEEVFSIYTWVMLRWTDARFTWDPKDYGDINKALVSASNTWTPMDYFQNSKSAEQYNFLWNPACEVMHNGKMECTPRTIFAVMCISKLAAWPYDTQRCRFEFNFKKNSVIRKAVLTFGNDRAMTMIGAEYGGTWNIVDYEQGKSRENETFYIELTIERQAMGLGTLITAPAIALMLLTICSMFLDVSGSVRIPIACLSLLSHFSILQLINYSIPQHSPETPTILIYIKASLVITAFTLMLSFLLNHISKLRDAPPPWISFLNTRIQNTPLRYIVQSSPQIATVSETLTKIHNNEWLDFISLINNVVLVFLIVLYIIFYTVYIPSPPPLV